VKTDSADTDDVSSVSSFSTSKEILWGSFVNLFNVVSDKEDEEFLDLSNRLL